MKWSSFVAVDLSLNECTLPCTNNFENYGHEASSGMFLHHNPFSYMCNCTMLHDIAKMNHTPIYLVND